jgi:hypothetical protein
MQRSFGGLLALSFVVTPLTFAQLPRINFGGGYSGSRDGYKGEANFSLSRPIELIANAPYSGEAKNESVQTLADGTHVIQSMRIGNQKVWRDSQGRVRIDQPLGGGGLGNAPFKVPMLAQIEDPVAGYIYILDDVAKVAHRVKAQVIPQRSMDPMARRAAPVAPADPTRPQTSAPEDLGTQTIDGVSVRGSRTTTVTPTGAQGNDGPITSSYEDWYSPELNLVIRYVSNDPRSGTHTMGIANLSRSDPDPTLFMVPADYTTVDENAKFTIKWDSTSGNQGGK